MPCRGASSKRAKLYCSVLYATLTRQLDLSDAKLFANRSALFANDAESAMIACSLLWDRRGCTPGQLRIATPMGASLKLLPGSTVRWRGRRYLIVDYESLESRCTAPRSKNLHLPAIAGDAPSPRLL